MAESPWGKKSAASGGYVVGGRIDGRLLAHRVHDWTGDERRAVAAQLLRTDLPPIISSTLARWLEVDRVVNEVGFRQALLDFIPEVAADADSLKRWAISQGLLLITSRSGTGLADPTSPVRMWLEFDVFTRKGSEWSGAGKELAFIWLRVAKAYRLEVFARSRLSLIANDAARAWLGGIDAADIAFEGLINFFRRSTAGFDPTLEYHPVGQRTERTPEQRFMGYVHAAIFNVVRDLLRPFLPGHAGHSAIWLISLNLDPDEGEVTDAPTAYPGDDPEAQLLSAEFWGWFSAALDTLTQTEWLVYILRDVLEEPGPAVAASLGLKEGNVRQILFRARRKLRDNLREAGFEPASFSGAWPIKSGDGGVARGSQGESP